MEAKFGNGTFLVQDLQVMYRMGITLYCAFLRRFVYACKYIYGTSEILLSLFWRENNIMLHYRNHYNEYDD